MQDQRDKSDNALGLELERTIERTVESEHKSMASRVVIPALGSMNLMLLIAYWGTDGIKPYVIAHSMLCSVFNVIITSKERKFTLLGRSFSTRDDTIDSLRWTYNLLITDISLLLALDLEPLGVLATWIILGLSALMDTFRRRNRFIVSIMAFLMGLVPMIVLHGGSTRPAVIIYGVGSYISTLLIFRTLERAWMRSVAKSIELAHKESDARALAERMKSEAIIGFQQRMISHEMANLTMIIDLYSRRLPADAGNAIVRAVNKIKSLNHLVLDKYNDTRTRKVVRVGELLDDVELLLGRVVTSRSIDFQVDANADVRALGFEEFDGSVYLIIQNLVKNAMESIDQAKLQGRSSSTVRLLVARETATTIKIQIDDDGVGMEPQHLRAVLEGRARSHKEGGHGLGNRLVHEECARNALLLGGQSKLGAGTSLWIIVKAYDVAPMLPADVSSAS